MRAVRLELLGAVVVGARLAGGCSASATGPLGDEREGVCPEAAAVDAFWSPMAGLDGPVVAARVEGCEVTVVRADARGLGAAWRWDAIEARFRLVAELPTLGPLVGAGGYPSVHQGVSPDRIDVALNPRGGGAACRDSSLVRWTAGGQIVTLSLPGRGTCESIGFDGAGRLFVAHHAAGRLSPFYVSEWTESGLTTLEPSRYDFGVLSLRLHRLDDGRVGLDIKAPNPLHPLLYSFVEASGLEVSEVERQGLRWIRSGLLSDGRVVMVTLDEPLTVYDPKTEAWSTVPPAHPGHGADRPLLSPSGDLLTLEVDFPTLGPGPTPARARLMAFDEGARTWWVPAGESSAAAGELPGSAVLVGVDRLGRPAVVADGQLLLGRSLL